MADAEAEEEAWPVRPTLGLDRGKKIVDGFLLPALAAEQVRPVIPESENVGG